MQYRVRIFYADAIQTQLWDAELLATYPKLEDKKKKKWRTRTGWYWQSVDEPDYGEGPFASREETQADAVSFYHGPVEVVTD